MLMLISSFLFLSAWALMTAHVLYKKKNPADLVVSFLFTIGVLLGAADRFYKDDPLFIFFGLSTAILAFIDFYYIPQVMKIERKIMRGEKKIVKKGFRAFARKEKGFF